MRIHLIEPDANGLISGGYVYNHRIAQAAPEVELHAVKLEAIERELANLHLAEPGLVLLDSLFLTRHRMAAFRGLAQRPGLRCGVLLHAFPSFIERAGDREGLVSALPLTPTGEELQLLEELDVLVALGPYVPELVAACGASIRACVCPPGVDREQVAGPTRDPGAPVQVLSIGSVTPLKGFMDGLEALAGLGAHQFRWTIMGSLTTAPECVSELRGRVDAWGFGDAVRFLGQCSPERVREELRRSDLLLVPSYTETFSLVALEAIALGVPVVGYEVGGLAHVVRPDETGLLVPLFDVSALANDLARLVVDPGERQRLAAGCVRAASSIPTWAAAARHFVEVLASV